MEVDLTRSGWDVSGGLFQGAGANMPSKGNGPLGVARIGYGRTGTVSGTPWSARAGVAASDRHADDLNLAAALPGIDKALTSRFGGDDRRLNVFLQGRVGRWRAQTEFFRAWLAPDHGGTWAAQGAYGQVSASVLAGIEIGARYEVFMPDVRRAAIPSFRQWDATVTYALPRAPIRLWVDYTARSGGWQPPERAWTLQAQWYLFRGLRVWR